jgi:hypothetical protein
MKSIVRFSAVLALAALVGCSANQQPFAPEVVDLAKHDSAISLKKTSVPFKVSVSGTLSFTSSSTVALTADGNASHLGKINYSGTVVITSQTPTQIIDDLTETLTAANGDQLTILCHQEANLTSQDGVYESTNDSWTVIGGTGRFSGATGSGSGTTHVDFNTTPNTFTKECSGTITY